jgi:hypothetical protein
MTKLLFLFSILLSFAVVNAQDTLTQYTGKYVFPDGGPVPEVEVTLTDGALSMGSVAGNSLLIQLGVDSFLIVEFSGTAVFKRAEDNKVNGVHIDAAGYILDGKKQDTGVWVFTGYYRPANGELLRAKK